jgi:hypothetical protein
MPVEEVGQQSDEYNVEFRARRPTVTAYIKESASMDPTMIRVVAGVLFVVVVGVIMARRKRMAARRKSI